LREWSCFRRHPAARRGFFLRSEDICPGYAGEAWPGFDHAVVTRPDPKKGEQIILFTTYAGADAKSLLEWGRASGITELMLPRDIRVLAALPVLGTGKVDYIRLAEDALASTSTSLSEVVAVG
jgi:acyl-[acyl-carrier-protein]-phospholipid O-acyltransferase/long-chain-fatty-acid--[acyl-carrier-protein] ligase